MLQLLKRELLYYLFFTYIYALTVCILRRFMVSWLLLTNMWYSSYVFSAFHDRGFTVVRLLVGYLKKY